MTGHTPHHHRGVQFLASLSGSFAGTAIVAYILDNTRLGGIALVFSIICMLTAIAIGVCS